MGGAAGHMAHLHEDLSLTFNELVSIIDTVASADIEVTEKVDGQINGFYCCSNFQNQQDM